MKRSAQITLVLLASAPAFALAGCDPTPPARADTGGTFQNMAQCVAQYDQATCAAAQKLAYQEHLNNAPHFTSRDQCILQYGPDACEPASYYGGSGGYFVPMMIGYMLGSAHSTPAPLYYAPYSYRHYGQSGYAAPIYSSSPSYRSAGAIGTAPLYRPSAISSLKSSTSLTPAQTTRGGFGSSFKPTQTFTKSYTASNPSSFGRSTYSSPSSYSSSSSSYSSSRSSYSGSSFSSGSVSRGGFGSTGGSFGGGSFGG